MKNKLFFLLLIIFFAGLLFFPGCKTEEANQYTLTVTVGEGVTGTPTTGTYSHSENDLVTYNYSLQTGYTDLNVTLDGVSVAASGTINITGNHTLTATAEEIFDVRGMWTGTIMVSGDEDLYFEITFSGGLNSGTTIGQIDDVSGTGNGTYTITDGQIDYTLVYPGGTVYFSGTIDDDNNMSGSWEVEPGPASGNWNLERQL